MTWAEVRAAAEAGRPLWYKAPLDFRPARVTVVRAFKNGKLRLSCFGTTWTADEGHAERFSDCAPTSARETWEVRT